MWKNQQILTQTDLESWTLALLVFHLGHISSSPWDLVLISEIGVIHTLWYNESIRHRACKLPGRIPGAH